MRVAVSSFHVVKRVEERKWGKSKTVCGQKEKVKGEIKSKLQIAPYAVLDPRTPKGWGEDRGSNLVDKVVRSVVYNSPSCVDPRQTRSGESRFDMVDDRVIAGRDVS